MSHLRSVLLSWDYMYCLSCRNVPITNHHCRPNNTILCTLQCRKVRVPNHRSYCRLHNLLQHGGLLLYGKDLADSTGDRGEYNSGLYSVRC
jgi:hypothetical protein